MRRVSQDGSGLTGIAIDEALFATKSNNTRELYLLFGITGRGNEESLPVQGHPTTPTDVHPRSGPQTCFRGRAISSRSASRTSRTREVWPPRAGELGASTRTHTLVGAPGGPMSCLEPPIGKPPDAIKNMIVVDGRLPCVLDGFTRSVAR